MSSDATTAAWICSDEISGYDMSFPQQWIVTATTASTASITWSAWTQADSAAAIGCANRAVTALQSMIVNADNIRAAQAHAQRQNAEHQRQAGLAQKRARKLLVDHLTIEQRKTYEERHYFDVGVGDKSYRIHHGTHGNVRLLTRIPDSARALVDPAEVVSFCAQPDGVPTEDAMLAQKLMLETDERKFLEIANWTDLRTGRLMDKRALVEAR